MRSRSALLSIALTAVYVLFFLWYTPLGGPLSPEEIDLYLERIAADGLSEADQQSLREFLETDTGGDFAMVNVIELREPPTRVEGVGPQESASDVLNKYMAYMWPALLRRACHPVLAGGAAAGAADLWGLDERARAWSQGAAMRYRSRRDMMEIATNPAFQPSHAFKQAAMLKTIAFPIDPWFHFGDPRLLGALFLAIGLLSIRLVASWPRSRAST
ncbi:MAG: hypothetical protein AAGK22_24980 [Acidobacteriota bacterium]